MTDVNIRIPALSSCCEFVFLLIIVGRKWILFQY